jgi:hypothetical protein
MVALTVPATLLIPQQNPSSHQKPSFRSGQHPYHHKPAMLPGPRPAPQANPQVSDIYGVLEPYTVHQPKVMPSASGNSTCKSVPVPGGL